MDTSLLALLDERRAQAGRWLQGALRADIACFLHRQLEDRLAARPRFAARLLPATLVAMRRRLDDVEPLLDEAGAVVAELRARLGAAPLDERLEAEAFTTAVGAPIVAAAESLLAAAGLPPDRALDEDPTARASRPTTDAATAPRYALGYTPSAAVAWAWRELRALDRLPASVSSTEALLLSLRLRLPESL